VLGLQYFVCDACEVVHATPEEPPVCADCGGRDLRGIVREPGDGAYFTAPFAAE
jgi:rRNA maturation endonuclease Nob1